MRSFLPALLTLLLLCLSSRVSGQDDTDSFDPVRSEQGGEDKAGPGEEAEKAPEKFYASRIRILHVAPLLGSTTPSEIDTLPLNFQKNAFPERNQTLSGQYLANLGSPFQSMIFRDRTGKSPFIFGRVYEHWYTSDGEQDFFNTTTPYTNLKYVTTIGNDVSQEENFKALFTVNLNKRLNVGGDYEILYARGFYNHNSNRNKLANLFGNYQGPRYELFWKVSFDYMENFENGGITDDRYITQPMLMSGGLNQYESLNIPVQFTDAKSLYRHSSAFLTHRYHLGFERMDIVPPADSLSSGKPLPKGAPVPGDTVYTFIPVTSFFHTLQAGLGQRSYASETVNTDFYARQYLNDDATADTCALGHLSNTLGIALVEGFHPWVKFGLSAFMVQEYRRYTRLNPRMQVNAASSVLPDYTNDFTYHDENLIWIGGELSKRKGSLLTFSAVGKLCLIGQKLGDFELKGNLNTTFGLWKRPVSLTAEGIVRNDHPDYFMQSYVSNHFTWSNDFANQYRTMLRGRLQIPGLGFEADGSVENITQYLYFDQDALPAQFGGNLQVVTLDLKQHLKAGILNWDNQVAWQLSSRPDILPLPDLTVYSDLYLKFMLSGVLTSHIGIDCRYFTAYHAQSYMPATGQFHNQDDIQVGNYPFMNAYANFHLKRMRFFVQYSHLSRLFVDPDYFTAPHYPQNPAIIKAGLSWNFYD